MCSIPIPEPRPVLVLDGHDGSGKTSLGRLLAERAGARVLRPFAGRRGAALMAAYGRGDEAGILSIGHEAIAAALEESPGEPLILDRGWLTVSTLVAPEPFRSAWRLWLPTVLLWCPLDVTLQRLGLRSGESPETVEWHRHFLKLYPERLEICPGPVLRTDLNDIPACLEQLSAKLDDLRQAGGDRPRSAC